MDVLLGTIKDYKKRSSAILSKTLILYNIIIYIYAYISYNITYFFNKNSSLYHGKKFRVKTVLK